MNYFNILITIFSAVLVALQWQLFKNKKFSLTKEKNSLQQEIILLNEKNNNLSTNNQQIKEEFNESQQQIKTHIANIATLQEQIKYIKNESNQHITNIENIKKEYSAQFKNIANEIIKNQSKEFSSQSLDHLKNIKNSLSAELLIPLRHEIKNLQTNIDRDVKSRNNLEGAVQQINHGYTKMFNALTGDKKIQGNWGEITLERILEDAGLCKNREYTTQTNCLLNEEKIVRPDIIIKLPENKQIIIDAKVSIKNYYNYVNQHENQCESLKNFITNIRKHIDSLIIYNEIKNTPDFVIMFMPIENSFSLLMQKDQNIFHYAWQKNIIIVGPSTLFAILRTISAIWKVENQNKNAKQIAAEAGKLYDKFAGFIIDMQKIGKASEDLSKHYNSALNKLSSGKGNLLNKTEQIKKLGAQTHKSIPEELLQN